jgi:PAS domain-containing protein
VLVEVFIFILGFGGVQRPNPQSASRGRRPYVRTERDAGETSSRSPRLATKAVRFEPVCAHTHEADRRHERSAAWVPNAVAGVARWSPDRKDGTPVFVELITVALRGEGGEITGYLGDPRDVTERKRAEQALREAQRRSEAILESITDAFSPWTRLAMHLRGLPKPLRALVGA